MAQAALAQSVKDPRGGVVSALGSASVPDPLDQRLRAWASEEVWVRPLLHTAATIAERIVDRWGSELDRRDPAEAVLTAVEAELRGPGLHLLALDESEGGVSGDPASVAAVLATLARTDACLAEWVLARTVAMLPLALRQCAPPSEPLADGWTAAFAARHVGQLTAEPSTVAVRGWVPGCAVVVGRNDEAANEWEFALVQPSAEASRTVRFGLRGCSTVRLGTDGEVLVPIARVPHEEVARWYGCAALWRAALALANGRAALDAAIAYAGTRYQGGSLLLRHPTIQSLIGEAYLGVMAGESLVGQAIDCLELRSWCGAFAVRAAERACWAAQQVLGGYGYMKEYGLEHRLRDAKVLSLLGGDPRRVVQDALRHALGGLAP